MSRPVRWASLVSASEEAAQEAPLLVVLLLRAWLLGAWLLRSAREVCPLRFGQPFQLAAVQEDPLARLALVDDHTASLVLPHRAAALRADQCFHRFTFR